MRRFRRPSPALIVAIVAVFLALAGTGYAATQLEPNSVGTAELRDGAVTRAKIEPATVTALMQGNVGPQGPVGPAGPTGPQGPAGPAGADGASPRAIRFDDAQGPSGGSTLFTAPNGIRYTFACLNETPVRAIVLALAPSFGSISSSGTFTRPAGVAPLAGDPRADAKSDSWGGSHIGVLADTRAVTGSNSQNIGVWTSTIEDATTVTVLTFRLEASATLCIVHGMAVTYPA
jgi:hypothetical protein